MAIGKYVGALILQGNGEKKKYLVEYRLPNPKGLTLPAGHVVGEELPEDALFREVFERSSLFAKPGKLIFAAFIPGDCPEHCEGHEWWVYQAAVDGDLSHKKRNNQEFVGYMSVAEMRPYIERGEIDDVWFKHILPALKII